MSGWRHAAPWNDQPEAICSRCSVEYAQRKRQDICTNPTPDPASPCAVCGVAGGRHERVLGLSPWCCPTHVPTRCACGHAIEKVSA